MHLELVYLAWIGIVPNSTILLVHISIDPKIIASSLKMICLAKFGLTSQNQLLQNPIRDTRRCLVVYLKFLGQLNFIGVQTQIPTQNSPSWSRRKAKFLWTTKNWPPRVFPYTLTHSSDVFSRLCVSATYWYWLIIYSIGWLFESVDSNLATKRIVNSAGRLWRG